MRFISRVLDIEVHSCRTNKYTSDLQLHKSEIMTFGKKLVPKFVEVSKISENCYYFQNRTIIDTQPCIVHNCDEEKLFILILEFRIITFRVTTRLQSKSNRCI
jgi:hypothetical protein